MLCDQNMICLNLRSHDPEPHADEVPEEGVENDEDCVGDVGGDREVRSELLLQLGWRRRRGRRIGHGCIVQACVPELKGEKRKSVREQLKRVIYPLVY